MTATPTPPFTGLAGLAPGDPMDSARLLGMIVALAGEVFVQKAEIARLKIALAEQGGPDEAALARAAEAKPMREWMAAEQVAFGNALMRPFTHPDESPDISHWIKTSR